MSTTVQHAELRLTTAYSVCRHIARSSAKNFYYGFMLLPARKRNALSAVYAFMRHADDLSDDPGMAPQERREKLAGFIDSYRRSLETGRTDDPVFLALRDSQLRYDIPMELLEQLVAGTGMDVREGRRRTAGRWWSMRASPICTTTAITWLRWWGWCASASSAIATRRPRSMRNISASPSS